MTPPEPDEPRLSFKEREMLTALRRLALAQSQVTQLEEKLAEQSSEVIVDPDDLVRLDELAAEIERLRHKATSRFGGGSARDRLAEAEMQQRLLLDRLGVQTADEARARHRSGSQGGEVDPAFVDFARRELSAAEEAYRQVLALPDQSAAAATAIDLTHPEVS